MGPDGVRPRQAEKAVALCRRAWRVVHRLYPTQFNRDVPNPWDGVTQASCENEKASGDAGGRLRFCRWRRSARKTGSCSSSGDLF